MSFSREKPTWAMIAPSLPDAAEIPWAVDLYRVGNTSPGTMKVVVFGPYPLSAFPLAPSITIQKAETHEILEEISKTIQEDEGLLALVRRNKLFVSEAWENQHGCRQSKVWGSRFDG